MPRFKMPELLVSRFIVKQLLSFWKLLWLGFSDSCSISYAKCSNININQRSENSFCTPGTFLWICWGNTVSHSSAVCLYLLTALCFQGKKKTKPRKACDAVTRERLSRSSVRLHLGCKSWGNDVPASQGACKKHSIWELWFTHICAL